MSTWRTQDHAEIMNWVEELGGFPATVIDTAEDDDMPGVLRIDFPDYSGEQTLQRISWDQFFEKFDEEDLDFLCQDETESHETSRFCKFVTHQE